ncbi:menaquinone via futalosine step 1 [Campylobacter sp. MIT 21-1685]|uniref:MqnA/MqnD/SBP family protein n=1 Tax=unclassified Campylobacter TaxID=2593542 RepID=UPI00224B06CD|nr:MULTISPECIES: MqnA/MqnD/SBP family protein [unclassified Campylobacter]MCX2683184.1 menaquinone via futalosine step 1 [Campylobacter sp. MIT 21-1684]MCX2751496.1 menaquinone via futalosine step 1 [Campylobacter sp. MIT 21-1682]MCX2807665.1 menaquinone via futalosine step 1 [Campylobacter sp. MIT 21-1685]
MIFGKIDYINLLPLHIYLKKYPLANGYKAAMEYKKNVPSKLNEALFKRRIDAGFVSSIESVRPKYANLDLGICANKKVLSVIVQNHTLAEKDKSSATSNVLAALLDINAKVIIGDQALKLYLQNPQLYTDLCAVWYNKTQLPFVFARFSCIRKKAMFKKILSAFLKKKIKIPQYILEKYSLTRSIAKSDIRHYLNDIIYYKIGMKEKRALKKFINLARLLHLKQVCKNQS